MSAIPKNYSLKNNCVKRIKPSLLRDVKTEAVLVFSRTALERYFAQLDSVGIQTVSSENEEADYVNSILRKLLKQLQECVVNVDYMINIVHNAKINPAFSIVKKQEEPLMEYYDVMASQVRNHYEEQPVYLPVFLVTCVLAEWILGEEKSTNMYPFLDQIDFLELIGKFEENRKQFEKNDECTIGEIHELSFKIITKLTNYKYKTNKNRVSKTRRK